MRSLRDFIEKHYEDKCSNCGKEIKLSEFELNLSAAIDDENIIGEIRYDCPNCFDEDPWLHDFRLK